MRTRFSLGDRVFYFDPDLNQDNKFEQVKYLMADTI